MHVHHYLVDIIIVQSILRGEWTINICFTNPAKTSEVFIPYPSFYHQNVAFGILC